MPRRESSDEQFTRLMDEIEVMAAILEDVEGEAVADQITMWIDYMIYRALYADEKAEAEFVPEARECRKLLLAHLDEVAWGDEPAVSGRRASTC